MPEELTSSPPLPPAPLPLPPGDATSLHILYLRRGQIRLDWILYDFSFSFHSVSIGSSMETDLNIYFEYNLGKWLPYVILFTFMKTTLKIKIACD